MFSRLIPMMLAMVATALPSVASPLPALPLQPSACHPSNAVVQPSAVAIAMVLGSGEYVDGVQIPDKVWECFGPAPVGCWWVVNSDCVDQAKQDYADAYNDAENEWWDDVEPFFTAMMACLAENEGDPEASIECVDEYERATFDFDVALAQAQSAALAAYLDADCCETVCD